MYSLIFLVIEITSGCRKSTIYEDIKNASVISFFLTLCHSKTLHQQVLKRTGPGLTAPATVWRRASLARVSGWGLAAMATVWKWSGPISAVSPSQSATQRGTRTTLSTASHPQRPHSKLCLTGMYVCSTLNYVLTKYLLNTFSNMVSHNFHACSTQYVTNYCTPSLQKGVASAPTIVKCLLTLPCSVTWMERPWTRAQTLLNTWKFTTDVSQTTGQHRLLLMVSCFFVVLRDAVL